MLPNWFNYRNYLLGFTLQRQERLMASETHVDSIREKKKGEPLQIASREVIKFEKTVTDSKGRENQNQIKTKPKKDIEKKKSIYDFKSQNGLQTLRMLT